MGQAVYERVYYHCEHCHTGWHPTDAEFGIECKKTPGAQQVLTRAGVEKPFEHEGHELLLTLAGLNVSAATIRRTTEETGRDWAERHAAGETFGADLPLEWHRDAHGNTVAYLAGDATSVRQQGPHGEAAEGRMANVVSVFNPDVEKLREAESRRNAQRTSAKERAAQTAETVPVESAGSETAQPTTPSETVTSGTEVRQPLVAARVSEQAAPMKPSITPSSTSPSRLASGRSQ